MFKSSGVQIFRAVRILLGASAALAGGISAANSAVVDTINERLAAPVSNGDQESRGSQVYANQCASCHGASLSDGRFAPPLKGQPFLMKWGARDPAELSAYISATMPVSAPGSLTTGQVADIVAYMLREERVALARSTSSAAGPAGSQDKGEAGAAEFGRGFGLGRSVKLPPPPTTRPNPLDHYTPVTAAMLSSPPGQDWLTWRRTSDDQGHSPLAQITPSNVHMLGVKWAWALPNGPNEATPLVHDGVLFAYGFGDVVQALDAENGDLLWQYTPRSAAGAALAFRKAIALFEDKVITTTSDLHVVALNAKSGKVEWDVPLFKGEERYSLTGGPLVADGMVIVGTGGGVPGGNYVVAFDARTGHEAWRFSTVQPPGAGPHDTWNQLPLNKRSGAAIWTPGSFDSESGLVFFGPSNTYDTAPLKEAAAGAGSNDGLYTNSTVALEPKTGQLRWHYQHVHNDQWDLDWAFERIVFKPLGGSKSDRVVLTAGKAGVHDVLEAATGAYRYSFDLGLQNLITATDPKTGSKTMDRSLAPGDGVTKAVCPHSIGGRNWMPSSFSPEQNRLFIVANETCMEMMAVEPGEGILSTNVNMLLAPRPGSDGRYGRLEAIDLKTRKPVWTARRRAPSTTGALSTSGGVVFAGYVDRDFLAFDAATGRQLWSTRLNDVPNSNPISYAVKGKQYVAIVVGGGAPVQGLTAGLVPEIKNPANRTSTLWVFELRDH